MDFEKHLETNHKLPDEIIMKKYSTFIFRYFAILITIGLLILTLSFYFNYGSDGDEMNLHEKSLCPYIYAHNGEKYVFAGEIISGASKPGIERYDYRVISELKPNHDKYLARLTREVNQIHYINIIQLKAIDHPQNMKVLIDKYSRLQTLTNPVLPKSAVTFTGRSILPEISIKDNYTYNFDEIVLTQETTDAIMLSWEKPHYSNQAKLIISAKNSLWLEHVFASFHALFGARYNFFSRLQDSKSKEYYQNWMIEQSIPLLVYLEIDGKWELFDTFELAGTMAMKDDILPINLRNIRSETINIKLETGFKFWEIDYAAMDFNKNSPMEVNTLAVWEAWDENGIDIRPEIIRDDQQYYVQSRIGNKATITFPVPEFTNEARTVILESKGYYHIIREQQGKARMAEIMSFREPGRMPLFSKELYAEQ
jgi:hypothetical protein